VIADHGTGPFKPGIPKSSPQRNVPVLNIGQASRVFLPAVDEKPAGLLDFLFL
jgi:hypothetical protein